MRAAVIGSGIAGLAAAIVLARGGNEVVLFERAAAALPVGSGLLLQPPGLAVLRELGLLDDALAHGERIRRLDGRTRTGRRVISLEYERWAPGAFGLGMHRGALWHLLYRAAQAAGVEVRTASTLAAIEGDGPCGLRLHEGGDAGRFDGVLLACGSRSALRAPLGFSDRTRPYAWGALYANAPMPEGWARDTLGQRFDGTGRMMGILPSGRDAGGGGPWLTLFWSERLDRMDELRGRGWDAWRAAALDLWPGAREVLAGLRGFADFTVAAYADVRVAPWVRRCTALIGDMAHGTSPQLGQGATLALLDARALGRALGAGGDIRTALARYESARRRHAAYYQWASRTLTPFFQSDGRLLGVLRDALMGPLGALPGARREFLATLTGHKTGILFGRLKEPQPPPWPRDTG